MPFVAVPNSAQSLDGTRDYIRENMNILRNTIGRNHVDVNDANYGKHNFSEYIDQSTNTPVIVAGECAVYGRAAGGLTQLTFTPDGNNNVYQLTRAIPNPPTNFALANGWSFLPGGLFIQWGSVNSPGSGPSTVTFPTPFTNPPFSIQITPRNDGSHSAFTYYIDGSPNNISFKYRGSTSGSDTLYWVAIGI